MPDISELNPKPKWTCYIDESKRVQYRNGQIKIPYTCVRDDHRREVDIETSVDVLEQMKVAIDGQLFRRLYYESDYPLL